jgi:CHASE3 domain sensor protein
MTILRAFSLLLVTIVTVCNVSCFYFFVAVNGEKSNTNTGKRTRLTVLNHLAQIMTSVVSKEKTREEDPPNSK